MKFTMLLALSVAVALGLEWEREMGIPETDAIVPEESLEQEVKPLSETGLSQLEQEELDHAKILMAIARLRAYCILAQDDASNYKKKHKNSAMIEFISEFGKVDYAKPGPPPPDPKLPHDIPGLPVELPTDALLHPSKKPQMLGNIVVLYSHAMGHARRQFGTNGLGKYALDLVEEAILSGEDVTQMFRNPYDHTPNVGLSYKVLGFVTRPEYLIQLSAPFMKFDPKLAEVVAQASNADTVAATAWLQSGAKSEYTSFLDQEIADAKAAAKKFNGKIVDRVLAVIHDTMIKTMDVTAPPEDAARFLNTLPMPNVTSMEELERRAEKEADDWVSKTTAVGDTELDKLAVHDLEKETPSPTPDPHSDSYRL